MKILLATCLLLTTSFLWADPPPQIPNTIPIQLNIMKPDAVQEDFLGKIASMDEADYKGVDKSGTLEQKSRQLFNIWGCLVEDDKWDNTGYIKEKEITVYADDTGDIQKRTASDSTNSVTSIKTYSFDVNRKSMTTTVTDGTGNLIKRVISVYDSYGKEQEVTETNADAEMLARTTMTRNSAGKETIVDFYGKDNHLATEIKLKWNPDGSKSEESFNLDSNGSSCRRTYDYLSHDATGNWTACVKSTTYTRNGEIIGQGQIYIERTISYNP